MTFSDKVPLGRPPEPRREVIAQSKDKRFVFKYLITEMRQGPMLDKLFVLKKIYDGMEQWVQIRKNASPASITKAMKRCKRTGKNMARKHA